VEILTLEEYRELIAKPKPQRQPAGNSQLESHLALLLQTAGLPEPQREFRFHPKRRWRSDFAWPEQKVIVEVEGAVFSAGRHTRGAGFEGDCEKYNEIALAGFTLIRVTGKHINNGQAIHWIREALKQEKK
jgi:very-short-patch-repair endonuclease